MSLPTCAEKHPNTLDGRNVIGHLINSSCVFFASYNVWNSDNSLFVSWSQRHIGPSFYLMLTETFKCLPYALLLWNGFYVATVPWWSCWNSDQEMTKKPMNKVFLALVVPSFFCLTIMAAIVLLGIFKTIEKVSYPCPDLCLSLMKKVCAEFLVRMFGSKCTMIFGDFYTQVYYYMITKSCPINWICHRWTPVQFYTLR